MEIREIQGHFALLRLTLDGVFGQRARRRDGAAQAGAEETLLRSTVHPDKPIQHLSLIHI